MMAVIIEVWSLTPSLVPDLIEVTLISTLSDLDLDPVHHLLFLRFLLGWLFADRHADDSAGRQNAFTLLRAVLSRKIVVPEVYDVMEWVQEIMVK
jgi:hypothetical protein